MAQRSHYMGRSGVVTTTTFFTPNGLNTAVLRRSTMPPSRQVIEPPLFIPLDFSLQSVTLAAGVASGEAAGSGRLDYEANPLAFSTEALGSPSLELLLQLVGIAPSEAFGSLSLLFAITPVSMASLEAVGVPSLPAESRTVTALTGVLRAGSALQGVQLPEIGVQGRAPANLQIEGVAHG